MEKFLKITLIWILAMQHSNTQMFLGVGYNFLGTHFWRGKIFRLLTWEGLKFLGPDFWNNTGD